MKREIKGIFDEQGYIPPIVIFSAEECRFILARLQQNHRQPPMDWQKSWAATSPDYHALATHDRILEVVTTLIGENVVLWGASLLVRQPGQVHHWHTDIESSSPTGITISVWIGLANTDAQSSLKVVPFSHHFGVTLQQLIQEKGRQRESVHDADVATWAKERDARSDMVPLDTGNGEAFFFDGRLWHGSHNLNRNKARYAVLLQYATPCTPIRIPNLRRLTWPFETYQAPKPACIVVSGHAMNTQNRIVPAPVANCNETSVSLSTQVHPLCLPLEQDPRVGWKPHHFFLGSTPSISKMECHASVLDPGRQPHPPHKHEEEEILMVLDGEAELVLEDSTEVGRTSRHRVSKGALAYYPSGFTHTICNPSAAPVTYLMFKWKTDRKRSGNFLRHRLVSLPDTGAGTPSPNHTGFSMQRILDGETECLKRFETHITLVEPGASYEPHVDAYDVGIVVMDGTVETLGERVGPHGVVLYAAGQPHGMKNVGDVTARYVVFEFHGRRCNIESARNRLFAQRLLAVLRDPKRLVKAVGSRAVSLLNLIRD